MIAAWLAKIQLDGLPVWLCYFVNTRAEQAGAEFIDQTVHGEAV